jgi:hypothetical protein
MPRRPTRSRRLATAARWPVGIALTSWQYMWRTTPMHRVEVAGSAADDAPPPLPQGVSDDEVQLPEHGPGRSSIAATASASATRSTRPSS